jgi:DNA polymerase III gamma/tau subunit
MLKFFLRDLMVYKLGIKKDRLLNIANDETLKKGAGNFSLAALIEIFETVAKTETAIMMNVNKRLAVENMLLKFYNKKADLC